MGKAYRQVVARYNKNNTSPPVPLVVHFTGWERCEKGHTFGPAARTHYLLHFVTDGQGTFYKKNKTYTVYPGSGFLITPYEITTYSADQTHPWEYYWVGFGGYEAQALLRKFGITAESPIFSFDKERIMEPLQDMIKNEPYSILREAALLSDLYRVFSVLRLQQTEQKSLFTAQQYIENAVSFIQNNYSYDLTVEKIASHIGIHRSYLYKLFIDYLGISVQQYLLEHRLKEACYLLKHTRYTIGQICCSCGFQDPDHFSKIFKQKMHLSPTLYRNQP